MHPTNNTANQKSGKPLHRYWTVLRNELQSTVISIDRLGKCNWVSEMKMYIHSRKIFVIYGNVLAIQKFIKMNYWTVFEIPRKLN